MRREETSTPPVFIEMPRKAKLFRVLMERELGIDWEHSFVESNSLPKSSLETNQVQDGYAEVQQNYDESRSSIAEPFFQSFKQSPETSDLEESKSEFDKIETVRKNTGLKDI